MWCLSLKHGMLSPAKSPSQWQSQCQKKLTLIPLFSHCNVCRNLNEVIMCFKYIGLGPEKINVCHRWLQDNLVYNNAMGQVTLPRAWCVTRQSRGLEDSVNSYRHLSVPPALGTRSLNAPVTHCALSDIQTIQLQIQKWFFDSRLSSENQITELMLGNESNTAM